VIRLLKLLETRKSIGAVLEIRPLKELSPTEVKLLVPTPVDQVMRPAMMNNTYENAMDEDKPEKSQSKKRKDPGKK
jgi:hypothetical protein